MADISKTSCNIQRTTYSQQSSVNTSSTNYINSAFTEYKDGAKIEVNDKIDKPLDFNSINKKEEFRKVLENLFLKYGVRLSDIEAEIKELVQNFNPDCCEMQGQNNSEFNLKPKFMERIYNYCNELLERAKSKGGQINLDILRNTHNEIIDEKALTLFTANKKITLEDIKEAGLFAELCHVAGRNLKDLSESELEKLLNCYQTAWREDDTKDARKIMQVARNYYTVSKYMTIEEFNEAKANGTIKSFSDILGIEENDSVKDIKEKIENFFNEQHKLVEQRIANGESKEDITNEQYKNLILMLAASDGKDKHLFTHILEHLYSSNKAKFVDQIVRNLSEEDRKIFANLITNRELQNILRNPDRFNERIDENEAQTITSTIRTWQDFETALRENASYNEELKAFLERDDVKALLEKLKNKAELNETEQGLYNELLILTGGAKGQIIGSANNQSATVVQREILIQNCCADLQDSAIYEQVMQGVREYIEQNPDSIKLSSNEFEEIVQNTAKANDDTNTTDTVSTSSDDTGYDYTASPLGFVQRPLPEVVLKPEDLKANLYAEEEIPKIIRTNNDNNKTKPEAPSTIEEAIATGKILEYLANTKENFITSTIELFNSGSSKAIDFACERFEIIGSVQTVVYESIQGISARLAAMGTMSASYLQKISPNSYYEKQIIDNKLKEQEEIAV